MNPKEYNIKERDSSINVLNKKIEQNSKNVSFLLDVCVNILFEWPKSKQSAKTSTIVICIIREENRVWSRVDAKKAKEIILPIALTIFDPNEDNKYFFIQ